MSANLMIMMAKKIMEKRKKDEEIKAERSILQDEEDDNNIMGYSKRKTRKNIANFLTGNKNKKE